MESNNKTGILNNGIRYIYNHTQNSSSVGVLIIVRYGSGFDKKSGLAHLLEHILFKGTKKRPQTREIMAELNSIGSEYNAYTSRTFTGYHSKSAYIHLEQSIDILSDLVANTNFYTKTFSTEYEQEKKIVVEELKAIRDNNTKYALELIDKNLFKGKLSNNSEDDISTISSITLQDVIETYNKYYVGSNIIVSINGNLGKHLDNIEDLLYKYLGHIKRGTRNNFIFKNDYFNNTPILNNVINMPNAVKAVVTLTYRDTGFASRTKYYMLELFRLVFCDLTSGRLFQEIREKRGLVYSIKSVHYSYDYLGYLCIRTNTDINNIDILVSELKRQIDLVKSDGLRKEELQIAKQNFTSKLLLDLEDSMTLSEYNAYETFYHSTDFMSYNNIVDLVNDIKLDEINKFINKLLSNDGILTIIKP
jgi:predicted Zn-dependent peptidase